MALGRGRGLDRGDEFFGLVVLGAGEGYEFVDLAEDGASLRGCGDGDSASAPKLERHSCWSRPNRPRSEATAVAQPGP
jgi:hypothetical protein